MFFLNVILNVIHFLTETGNYCGFISFIAWFDFAVFIDGIADFHYWELCGSRQQSPKEKAMKLSEIILRGEFDVQHVPTSLIGDDFLNAFNFQNNRIIENNTWSLKETLWFIY